MKHMKRIFALALALVMVLGLATTAFAAEDGKYSITINNDLDGHTYEAYQIFKGDLKDPTATDNAGAATGNTLSNIVWGTGVTCPADGIVIGKDDSGNEIKSTNAADVAEALAKKKLDLDALLDVLTLTNVKTESTDKGNYYMIENLEPGYYLIKDQDNSLDEDHDAYTSFIIEVIENSTVNPKSAFPTVDKQVQDEVADKDANSTDDAGWGETADHAINETFQFKLIANLPADTDFAAYETYMVKFNDTMSAGITFEEIVSVTVDGQPLTAGQYSYTATEGQKGGSWTLTIADITVIEGVNLTDGAVIEVVYEAHLNEDAVVGDSDANKNTVNLEYSNNPNASGEGEHETGKTPDDTVWVFTYKVDSTKYKDSVADTNKLDGAGFTLYYSADGKTKGEAVKLIFDATDNVYRPAPAGATEGVVTEMTSANGGVFNVAGLDVGTYIMEETNVPAGYNKCADIVIVITAQHSENTTSASTTINMTIDGGEATVNEVVNKSGVVLPETGGMGTTLFYVFGGILVLSAVVLMVTKKRMASF